MFLYTRNVLLNTKATEKRGTPMQPTAQKNNAKQRKTIAIVAVIAVVAIALAAVAIIAVANKREMTQAASDTCTLNAKALATHQQNFEEAQKEAEDAAKLTVDDVADGICKKLIFRHPHIFGDVKVGSTDEILSNWDDLKRKEKKQETDTSTLESVSKSLPSLIRAQKLQKKAAKVGFDWPDVSGALDKVEEELAEVRAAIGGDGDVEEEIGDLIFAVTNVSRFVKVDSERAAEKTCNKFVRRFADMEQQAKAQGKQLSELTLEEMDALWDEAKKKEHRE